MRAFNPQDALLITATVVTLGEELINKLSVRAQNDLIEQAEHEVTRAERLRRARSALRILRNQEGILDPRGQAEEINRLIN